MANSHLFPLFCYFVSRVLLINDCRGIFSFMPVDNSTFCLNSSILPSPKYLSNDIPYILRRCQCSRISTPKMAISTVFMAWISIFDNCKTSSLALVFLVRKANIAPDDKYFTREKCTSTPFLTLANVLFRTSIKSGSDIGRPVFSHGKKILLLWYSVLGADCCLLGLQLLCLT